MIHVHNKVAYSNPFPGLRSFEQEEAYLSYGRDNQVRDLNKKLTNSRFLSIIRSLGSGTSSLIKAGLIPQLIDDQSGSSSAKKWEAPYFNPEATPIRNLARALYQTLSKQSRPSADRSFPNQIETIILTNSQKVLGWCGAATMLFIIDPFMAPRLDETRNGVG